MAWVLAELETQVEGKSYKLYKRLLQHNVDIQTIVQTTTMVFKLQPWSR
jgi:hypothetical protein